MKKIIPYLIALAIATPAIGNGITYSKNESKMILGGVREEYNPERIKINQDGNYIFLGRENQDIEIGFGREITGTYKNLYGNAGFGTSYETRKFRDQSTRNNFHISLGGGLEFILKSCRLRIGMVYDHFSNGKAVNPFVNKDSKNSGINTIGYSVGVDCS